MFFSRNVSSTTKPTGSTPAERYLAGICRNSFLSLWNYSNPYTADGKDFSKPKSVGKELCDQLVVCGNHVLLFSDKDCAYPQHSDATISWGRYYQKALWKSAGQLFRAEKYVRDFPHLLYEDAACTQPLRATLPPPAAMKIHRILVVHGVHEECRQLLGGSGSLALDTRIVGRAHYEDATVPVQPFTIGHICPKKGFVHVFDDVSLVEVMRCVDTITDFVEYLEDKEQFLSVPGRVVYAAGEEELLACYLQNAQEPGRHCFPTLKPNAVVEFEAGEYVRLLQSPHWARRQVANQVSYAWDEIIEYITGHYEADTMHFSSDKSFEANEKALRAMAQESRLSRRVLARKFFELIADTPLGKRRTCVTFSELAPGVCFALLVLPPPHAAYPYDRYRKERMQVLLEYCSAVKLKFFGDVQYIVGIATDGMAVATGQSFDLLHYDGNEWEEGERELAEAVTAHYGYLRNPKATYFEEDEYVE